MATIVLWYYCVMLLSCCIYSFALYTTQTDLYVSTTRIGTHSMFLQISRVLPRNEHINLHSVCFSLKHSLVCTHPSISAQQVHLHCWCKMQRHAADYSMSDWTQVSSLLLHCLSMFQCMSWSAVIAYSKPALQSLKSLENLAAYASILPTRVKKRDSPQKVFVSFSLYHIQ